MNKTVLIIITLGLVVFLGIIFSGGPKTENTGQVIQNVEVRDGVQYVTITAKGGYTPRVSNAKADLPTKILVNTKDTFDCSASLAIPSLNYQKLLAQNSETEIDIGTYKTGESLKGLCGMGMYNFEIDFT